jgi:hypothetical protein
MISSNRIVARSIEPAWVLYKDRDANGGGEASRLKWLVLQAPISRNALVSGSYTLRAELRDRGVLIQRRNGQEWQDVGLLEFSPYGDIPDKVAIRLAYFYPRNTPESGALEEAWAAARLHILENGLKDRRLVTAGVVPEVASEVPSMIPWSYDRPTFYKVDEMVFDGSPAQFHALAIRVENERAIHHHRLPDPLPIAEPSATSTRVYFLLYGVSEEFGYVEAVSASSDMTLVGAYANQNQLLVVKDWWVGLRTELERIQKMRRSVSTIDLGQEAPNRERDIDVFTKTDDLRRQGIVSQANKLYSTMKDPTWEKVAQEVGESVRTLRKWRKDVRYR